MVAAFLALVVLAVSLGLFLAVEADADLWWHVRTGELILSERHLPTEDPFSFTFGSVQWVNHEWLADAVFAATFRIGGDRALLVLRGALLVTFLGGLATLLWRRLPHPLLVVVGLLAAGPWAGLFLNLRPHAFTWVFTVVALLLIEAADRWPGAVAVALTAILVLWVNLHGGFLLGLAVVSAALGGRLLALPPQPEPLPPAARRWLWIALAACWAAPLANPYGWRLLPYLGRELLADHGAVSEWQAIALSPDGLAAFLAFASAAALAFLAVPRGRRYAEGALLALAVVSTWRHGRFLILVVLFSTLTVAAALGAAWHRWRSAPGLSLLERLSRLRYALALGALVALAGSLQLARQWRENGLHLPVDPSKVPLLAVDLLRDHELGPHLATRLDWGGYAIWHLWPRYRVSVDGRNLTVYPQSFVNAQLAAYGRGELSDFYSPWPVDVFLVEAAGPAFDGLSRDPRWQLVYRGPLAAIFLPPETARDLRQRRLTPPPKPRGEERFHFP